MTIKMNKKLITFFAVAALMISMRPGQAHAEVNLLSNASFEQEIGNGVGKNWDNTNGATRINSTTVTGLGFTAPPNGDFALLLAAGQFTFQLYNSSEVRSGDYVSFSGFAQSDIAGGANGVELRIEFVSTNPDGSTNLISAVNSSRINAVSAPAGRYTSFSVSGQAPANTDAVVFVVRHQAGAGNAVVDSVSGTIARRPAQLNAFVTKDRVKRGDVVTVSTTFQNLLNASLHDMTLNIEYPKGFDLLRDTVELNGKPTTFRDGSIIIPISELRANETASANFQLVASSGVVAGKRYDLSFQVRNSAGVLSETKTITLLVENDPVFDEGTIIGKVFNDLNQNTVQDPGEKGVPWVRLATEYGVEIITDEEGRYSIPAVQPGRHVVKIDGHTLPEGTKFITEESYLVRTTPGIMSKANFAVLVPPSSYPKEFEKDLMVSVTQGLDTSRPDLEIQMVPDLLRVGIGVLEAEPTFKLKLNYPEFVKNWYLEIRDEMGREVWTGFGVSAPPSEVTWNGQTETGLLPKPGIYSYQFKVEDKEGRQDWTPLHFFRVVSKADANSEARVVEIPPVGNFNIMKDGKRSIPLIAKPTLRVQGKTKPGNKIMVNNYPLVTDEEGRFQMEMYTSPGQKEVVVSATSPEGETTTFRKNVVVKDSTFFMVALGEEQLGVNFNDGDIETAGNAENYQKGFYEDGRLSYYLRGKLKGKFLVKSRYDTSDTRTALFTNLDPDNYYPIYGDSSSRNYEAQDTLKRLYLVVEMDRSFLKYGSFKTDFTDTELATYNRTLSGLKIHQETLASNAYGDAKRGFDVFASQSYQKPDHNEFLATGGSLYYVRNRHVIQGSEKIRVEIRDKIQDIAIDSKDLKEGQDYEIDYEEGRILLTRPLSSVSASDTLINDDILGGNPTYLIVDYEYDSGSHTFGDVDHGLRGYTYLGNHLRLGGTAVEEKRQNGDYDLRGVDMMMKFGRNTKISAEYAETNLKQTDSGLSTNGGLSFADISPIRAANTRPRENSYLVKAQSKPVKNLDLSGYVKNVEPPYSVANLSSQEGTKKYGTMARYNFTDQFYARYRFDRGKVSDVLEPLSESGVIAPYQGFHTHTGQLVYDNGKLISEAEYRLLDKDLPDFANQLDSVFSEMAPSQAVAGKVGYRLNERLLPYVKTQVAVAGKSNHQFGGGVRYEIMHDLFGYIEEMVGNYGDSTLFGVEKTEGRSRTYANLRMFDRGVGSPTLATSIGNSYSLSEKSRVYSEREYSTYQAQDGYADIMGYEAKAGEHWMFDAKFERRYLSAERSQLLDPFVRASILRNNDANTVSGGVGYTDGEKLQTRSRIEFRRENDSPKLVQIVTRQSLRYKINPDLSYLGKLDYGKSRFLQPDGTPADFMELSTGFAYRPVNNDKLNILSRYTYVMNIANDVQFANELYNGVQQDETAHIFAVDLAYDLHRYLGFVEKLAYKIGQTNTSLSPEVLVKQFLWVNRLNFHVTRKWDVAAEYRTLWQFDALDSLRQGALFEVDRELYEYVRFGMGYNFTDFDDDLRKPNNYNSHGPFVRFTGKF